MTLSTVLARMADPVHDLVVRIIDTTPKGNRKVALMSAKAMSSLPFSIPGPAAKYFLVGLKGEFRDVLKQKGLVYHNEIYVYFAEMSLREAWGYVNDLQNSVDRDRARIKRLKLELTKAEKIAGSLDSPRSIGDLLGMKKGESIA